MKTETIRVAWDPHTGVATGERLGAPVTEEELVAATGYSIDQVDIVPDSIETKAWPTSMKLEKRDDDGQIIQSEPIQVWNHYLRMKFNPRYDEVVSGLLRDELLEEIRAEKAGAHDPKPPTRDPGEDGVVVELDLFDPHFQLLAWGEETGNDHDLLIISDRYREAAACIRQGALRLGYPIKRWLLPIGQDLFHTDKYLDGKGGTTASGTPQDVDTRLAKAARQVRLILTEVVLDLLESAPVDVLTVPGNHDTERSWWMGEILDARFEGNPNVAVDNEPRMRKYYRIGNSLLGFSHGHKLKDKDLRDYMSQEARTAWAETAFREWHIGHYHHEYVRDTRGILVRQLPSLAGTDAWHFQQGFVHSQRGARGFVWSQDRGIIHTINFNVPVTQKELNVTEPTLRGDR